MSIASQLSFSTATSVRGGALGSIPYQGASSSTLFVSIGSAGTVLTSSGTVPIWAPASSTTVGTSTQVNTVLQTASNAYYLTFVDSNNAVSTAEAVYTTSTFTINPATGFVGIGSQDGGSPLNVKVLSTLSGTINSFQRVFTTQASGGVGNNVYRTEWRRRRSAGTDWTTQNIHDGIWVDASFTTPGTDTRTWWERDPNTTSQAWGDQATTWMFVNSTGLGVGTTSPQAKFVVSNAGANGLEVSPTGGISSGALIQSYNRSGATYTQLSHYALGHTWQVGAAGSIRAVDIDSTGKLGVGLAAPGSIFETEENTTGVTEHRITNSNTGANTTKQSRLTFRITDTVGTRKDVAYITALPVNADSATGDHLAFYTRTADATPTEKVRITNNGGISFGATGTAYGTSGQVLQSNGDAPPTWVPVSGTTVGTSTQVTTVLRSTNATHYLTFVDSNNASAAAETVYTTSTFSINPATGLVNYSTGGIVVGDTTNAITLQSDYSFPLIVQRSSNSGKGAIVMRGSDTIGTAIEHGRSNVASHWGTYQAFLVHDDNTSDALLSIKEKMRINATGVGIGTTSPSHALTVQGTAAAAGTLTALTLRNSSDGGVGMNFTNSVSVPLASINALVTSAGAGTDDGILAFSTAVNGVNTERFRADATGNLILNGLVGGAGNAFIIRGGTGAIGEGAQIIMGYGNNTSSAITGQSNNTWNIDVASGLANNNFRIFRQNSAGATVVAAEITEASGGIQLVSVGVGTTSSGITGEIRATNEITAYFSSDIRLKENIRLIADPITIVNQIRGVYYDWTDEHIAARGGEDGYFVRKHDIGVIAQEVEKVLPEIVATRDDGTKVVKYEKLVALLIEAVKDQQQQINQISQALQNLAIK